MPNQGTRPGPTSAGILGESAWICPATRVRAAVIARITFRIGVTSWSVSSLACVSRTVSWVAVQRRSLPARYPRSQAGDDEPKDEARLGRERRPDGNPKTEAELEPPQIPEDQPGAEPRERSPGAPPPRARLQLAGREPGRQERQHQERDPQGKRRPEPGAVQDGFLYEIASRCQKAAPEKAALDPTFDCPGERSTDGAQQDRLESGRRDRHVACDR